MKNTLDTINELDTTEKKKKKDELDVIAPGSLQNERDTDWKKMNRASLSCVTLLT